MNLFRSRSFQNLIVLVVCPKENLFTIEAFGDSGIIDLRGWRVFIFFPGGGALGGGDCGYHIVIKTIIRAHIAIEQVILLVILLCYVFLCTQCSSNIFTICRYAWYDCLCWFL